MARLLCLILLLFLASCSKIAMGLMGVKDYDNYTKKEIIQASQKFKIPQTQSYIIDSLYYKQFGFNKKEEIRGYRKDLFQPLQIRIYDKNGKLIGHRANCNVPGFPNLKWNGYGYFNAFPPTLDCHLIDTIQNLTLAREFDNISPLFTENATQQNNKYDVFIYWSRFMNRQSKLFIKKVHKYYSAYNDSINYYYVNTEPLFY